MDKESFITCEFLLRKTILKYWYRDFYFLMFDSLWWRMNEDNTFYNQYFDNVVFKENVISGQCFSLWKKYYSTLKEHQMTLTLAIFQKFLITMVVYEKFFFYPWKLFKAFLLIQERFVGNIYIENFY